MLDSKAFANAATAVIAVFFVVCLVLSYIAPNLIFSIANSWVHSLNLEVLQTKRAIPITTALWGLLSISAVTWITIYAMIELYNHWVKK